MFYRSLKYINYILIVITLLLFSISCYQKKGNEGNHYYNKSVGLSDVSSFNIKIDSLASTLLISYQYFIDLTDGKEYLIALDNNRNGLLFYDLISKKLSNQLFLPIEGPDGVGKLDSFFIKSMDSIYVSSGKSFVVSWIDKSGSIKKKYKTFTNGYNGNIREIFGYQPYFIHNKINYGIAPYLNPFNKYFFKDSKLNMALDLINSSITYSISYPDSYTKDTYCVQDVFNYGTFNYSSSKAVHSFPIDNYVYVYDTLGIERGKFWAGSDYFQQVEPMKNQTQDSNLQFKHFLNNHHYEKILYDKYRKVYYRYAIHPNNRSNKINNEPSLKFSIIILDENFNKIGETMLPIYLQNSCIYVSPKGLFLQSIPNDDDKITFHLLKLIHEKN